MYHNYSPVSRRRFEKNELIETILRKNVKVNIQKRKMLCSQYCPVHSVILTLAKTKRPEVFVTFRYPDHIGWNTLKIISRSISLRFMLWLIPTWASWSNWNTPKLGWNSGGVRNTKHMQYLRNGAR